MNRLNIFASVTVWLLLWTPAFSNDNDTQSSAQAKSETTGHVIIEINGVPQVIELGSSPAVLEKQLKGVVEGLNKKSLKTNSRSKTQAPKTQAPKTQASGSFSYHTIIVGPDGVVQEAKGEQNLNGNFLDNKQMLKNLPEPVRKQIEEAMKTAGQKSGLQMKIEAGKPPTAQSKKMDIEALLKNAAADLPADIQKQLMKAIQGIDASNMNLGNVQARAIVIGTDGKMKDYNLDKDENKTLKTKKTPTTSKSNLEKTPSTDAKVMDALNQILERLDKIESELETLKKSNP